MPPNPRVARAFRAMRDIGISEEKVKPVLKNLLKLYDKNWELIEEENYRVLADAIFDNEEAQAAENKKMLQNSQQERDSEEEAQESDELERPLKRLRLRYQGGQASQPGTNASPGLAGTSLVQPKDEPVDLPEIHSNSMLRRAGGPGQPNEGDTRTESPHASSQSLDRNKGKEPVAPDSPRVSSQSPDRNKGKEPVASDSSKKRSDPSEPVGAKKSLSNVLSRNESNTTSHPMRLRNRQKDTLSPQITSGERRVDSERPSHAVHLQEPRIDCSIILTPKCKTVGSQGLIKPKEEPCTDDVLPLTVLRLETSEKRDSSKKNSSIRDQDGCEPIASKSLAGEHTSDGVPALSEETGTSSGLAKVPDESSSQRQIASSSSGEVTISLNCNISPGRLDFHMPSLDELVKFIEDKYFRSYRVLDPNFSLMKVMKVMCEGALELGTEPSNKSQETIKVSPSINLLKKVCSIDPFVSGGMPFNISNGLCNDQSADEAALPETLLVPPACNGLHDSTQPDKDASAINKEGREENEQNGLVDTNSMSMVVVQQHQLTPDQIRALYDVSDISKGQERVIISLVNEINSECPPSFYYIPRNAAFQNAYVNFALARIGNDHCCSTCFGDCLPLCTPCACAHETGGEFAYTAEGVVKEEFLEGCVSMNHDPQKHCQFFCKECPLERSKHDDIVEPCKGHLVRKFIKECWWKCGCSSSCGNRVVQRGITCNLQVFMTEVKGWGLRTLEDLPKGAFVCEYVGEVLTSTELFDRVSKSPKGVVHSYPVLLDADWVTEGVLKDEEALCLDATYYGNVARFINHRCVDSNLVEIPVEVETPDHHYYHLAFFTTRKVQAMEELTWDYGIDFDDLDHPVKAFRCQCGSKFCRNIRRPSRSRSSRR